MNAGVSVITLDDGQELTADRLNKDFASLLISLSTMHRSHQESALKSERLKSAWQNKRVNASSKKLTSKAPAWLRLSDDKSRITEISGRADTIREIYSLSKRGYGSTSIQRYLNNHLSDHPPFSENGKWNRSYIQKILENPAVYGEFQPHKMDQGKRVPDGSPIPNYFPVAVTKSDFLLSRSQVSSRRLSGSGRKGTQFSNLFTRLAACGHCGATIGFLNKGKLPKGGNYLRCVNASSNSLCNAPGWKYESFEQSFIEWITEVNLDEILNPTDITYQLESLAATKLSVSERLEELKIEFENLLNRIGKVEDRLFEGMKRRAVAIEKEQDDLNAQFMTCNEEETRLRSAQTQGLTKKVFTEFSQAQSELSPDERRDLRVQIHKHMRDQIELITIHNIPDQIFQSDDLEEVLPHSFISALRYEGVQVDDETKLREFIFTEKGLRRLEYYQRYFFVKFRNGAIKKVQPDARQAQFTISKQMAAMMKRNANSD